MAEERKDLLRGRPRRRRRRRVEKPVTLAEVDQFLASWVPLNYLRFSDSSVKRRVIRMLLFLRGEVDRLQPERTGDGGRGGPPSPLRWVERVEGKALK